MDSVTDSGQLHQSPEVDFLPSTKTMEEQYRIFDEEYLKSPRRIKEEAYRLQFRESDGFDIKDFTCDRRAIGKIRPLDLSYKDTMAVAEEYAEYGINVYNKKYKGKKKLDLVKVEKSMIQCAGGLQYYLTFVAYNPIKDRKKTYQALVTGPLCDYEVVAFRSKPKEDVQCSTARPKKWKWDNRYSDARETGEEEEKEKENMSAGQGVRVQTRSSRDRRPSVRLRDYAM